MQSATSIRQAALELDEALEACDLDRVVACFSADCTIELLTYRDNLVTSLRPHFDPIDFAPTLGPIGRAVRPALSKLSRGGPDPFEEIHRNG